MRLPAAALAAVALVLVTVPHLPVSTTHAQESKLEIRSTDTVRSVLERLLGKRVGVVLTTGSELAGVVDSVGERVVHLSALTGREFSDAVVSLEQIGAVIIRVR